jgi:hypothetical protein
MCQQNTENFDPNLSQSYLPVNYNKLEQNCDQLTWSPSECNVKTVIPSNVNVCGNESLTPITNNQKDCRKKKKDFKKRPSVSLKYDFDLLSSFNNSELNNNLSSEKININEYNNDLITDVRSLNSLENDLLSNY